MDPSQPPNPGSRSLTWRHLQAVRGARRVLIVMPERYLGGVMPNHSGINKVKRRKLLEAHLTYPKAQREKEP